MSRDKLRLLDYLQHIREAIKRIENYVADSSEVAFLQQEMMQDAVIRNLEIIGRQATISKFIFPTLQLHIPSFHWPLHTR